MNDRMIEYDKRLGIHDSEYIGKNCTECGVEITKQNDNQDGLCISCMIEAVQDHCP